MDPKRWWEKQEDIVISKDQIPRCDNKEVKMFGGMLLACDDVVTEDQLSWAPGFTDLPKKRGKKKDLNKFDAGILPGTSKQNNPMDPQVRLLLEASWEAMVDAGINPRGLRGSQIGDFDECATPGTSGTQKQNPVTEMGCIMSDTVPSMFSNRISYTFDLQGPSHSADKINFSTKKRMTKLRNRNSIV
ncbi:Beta-ketoacyl synthase-like N-terminal domain-containing protein [Caenorhabditis elegans]|uniref:Beta-ketoacyl synthase-like N-terminal domain-containing protein n=1 Tax=Caenorhabditis elegans TaxID=6239 RepID=P91866_CAEEL|nr:Beta-ketoacyl synthase N-terminal domain-containing protein [Caenorhabditis elegans]CAB04239.1 Beta-ketoacyl synthase N-terminal domain-containing protein [Caenorhabditis elegans]|eukprot:NP_492421.1 Uncharacterized protein CELE_F32H2.6 [Caenorhabditis elegans]